MFLTFRKLTLASLSLTALGLMALPVGVRAQDTPPPTADSATDVTIKKVTLDLESTNLYSALKLLFGHINANYYLDPTLKNAEVSVHLHDIPFKTVLDTLVKSTGLPLTWKYEDNIYRIVPKEDEKTSLPESGDRALPETPEARGPKIIVLSRDSFVFDGLSIAEALGGKNFSILPRVFDTNPYTGTQSGSGTGSGTGSGGFGGGGLGGNGTGSGSGGFGGGGTSGSGRGRGF